MAKSCLWSEQDYISIISGDNRYCIPHFCRDNTNGFKAICGRLLLFPMDNPLCPYESIIPVQLTTVYQYTV